MHNDSDNIRIKLLSKDSLKEVGEVIIESLLPRLEKQGLSKVDKREIIARYNSRNMKNYIDEKIFVIALDENKKIVGVGGLRKDEGSFVFNRLTTFYVLPNYQRKGIGKMLYEFLKIKAVENGCRKLVVSSSPEAELFYKSLGFIKRRVDWKEFEDGRKYYNVWMEKILTS